MLGRFLSEICHLPTRQTARFLSVLRVSSVGCPVAFCGVLQALLVSRRQQNRREGRFLCCPVLPWKRLGSQDGASGGHLGRLGRIPKLPSSSCNSLIYWGFPSARPCDFRILA